MFNAQRQLPKTEPRSSDAVVPFSTQNQSWEWRSILRDIGFLCSFEVAALLVLVLWITPIIQAIGWREIPLFIISAGLLFTIGYWIVAKKKYQSGGMSIGYLLWEVFTVGSFGGTILFFIDNPNVASEFFVANLIAGVIGWGIAFFTAQRPRKELLQERAR